MEDILELILLLLVSPPLGGAGTIVWWHSCSARLPSVKCPQPAQRSSIPLPSGLNRT